MLPDLAYVSDLQVRGVTITSENTELASEMIAVASTTIREAAGSPIFEKDSTVTLISWGGAWLDLPGKPVTAVASVTIDGTAVTDYTLDRGRLWRRSGWGCESEPTTVVVEMTHGLLDLPADIINLTCDLAIAGMLAASEGAGDPRKVTERIDDYSVTFAQGAERVASIMELPRATRLRLRTRFGGGAGMVTHR